MLPARHRLTESGQFRTATRRGERAGTRTLVLHLQLTKGATPPVVGFVVSKAVGVAVTRNLVKRRLRHLVRDRLAALPVGAVLVVRALPGSAGASYDELAADLDRGFSRLNLVSA